jgi:serine/threonine protein kinase
MALQPQRILSNWTKNQKKRQGKKRPYEDPKPYKIGEKIGEGARGTIYKGAILDTTVVFKTFNDLTAFTQESTCYAHMTKERSKEQQQGLPDRGKVTPWTMYPPLSVRRQIATELKCENIIALELCRGATLLTHITKSGPEERNILQEFCMPIAKAVQYLHSIGIAHGDLSFKNVMVHHDLAGKPHAQVLDFETAHVFKSDTSESWIIEEFPITTWCIVPGDVIISMTKAIVELQNKRHIRRHATTAYSELLLEELLVSDTTTSVRATIERTDVDSPRSNSDSTTDSTRSTTSMYHTPDVYDSSPNDIFDGLDLDLFSLWKAEKWFPHVSIINAQTNPFHNDMFATGVLMLCTVIGGYWNSIVGNNVYLFAMANIQKTDDVFTKPPDTVQPLSVATMQFLFVLAMYSRILDPWFGPVDHEVEFGTGHYSSQLLASLLDIPVSLRAGSNAHAQAMWPPTNPTAVTLLKLLQTSSMLKLSAERFNEFKDNAIKRQIISLLHPDGASRQWTT